MSSLCGGTSKFFGPPDHPLDRRTLKPNAVKWGWILLFCGLVIYGLTWGVGATRAFKCLKYRHPPTGHWYDNWSVSVWSTLLALAGSAILLYLASRLVGNIEQFKLSERLKCVIQQGKEGKSSCFHSLPVLGVIWSMPLFITRYTLNSILPESICETSSSKILLTWRHLTGPAEELWFAAALAAIVILTRGKPGVRLLWAVVCGGLLRGVFHVYQGWESLGLFVWGALVAVAVAWTGRWVMFFILHFINNFFISIFHWTAWKPPLLFLGVFSVWFIFNVVRRFLRKASLA